MISRLRLKWIFLTIIFLMIADLQGAYSGSLQVPSFLTNVPAGHFAGVSVPCPNLSEARKSAIHDVIRQVLGSIGASYGFESKHHVKGNFRGKSPWRAIEENLSATAKGIVLGVERNIVKSTWSKDVSGKFVYFILVQYPEKKILEMRRLSKGARLIATDLPHPNTDEINLKVSEVNGVSVVLTSADISVIKKFRFSKAFSIFVWKVPSKVKHKYSIAIDPVKVCGNSVNIHLSISFFRKSFTDYLLGADFANAAMLNGYDEIGRIVSVKIEI